MTCWKGKLSQQYLPNHLKIGDYGIFVDVKNQNDIAIYIYKMSDLNEASLGKLADSFANWAKKYFATEIFLENWYHKQDTFKRSQMNAL